MREPIAAKQRRRSSGNWAAWAPAAMRSTRVVLVIYVLRCSRPPPCRLSDGSTLRTPSASRYFSARMSSGLSSSPTDWDLEHVLSAIRASVLEAPANPGMGTRPPRNARERAHLGSQAKACTVAIRYVRHWVAQHPARSSTTPSVPVAASSADDTGSRRPAHASPPC
ncbi:hypothetical protein B0H14DRAFT_1293772 [Mycena olivaceomarginata]|nr:hypothetical protein B0H14DRAFT_1293772 [Mycena olivaceomarginata]